MINYIAIIENSIDNRSIVKHFQAWNKQDAETIARKLAQLNGFESGTTFFITKKH